MSECVNKEWVCEDGRVPVSKLCHTEEGGGFPSAPASMSLSLEAVGEAQEAERL